VASMLADAAGSALTVTSEDPELCDHFLLLLDGHGMHGNAALHNEIEAMLRLRVGQPSPPLLLVHEQRAEPEGAAVPFGFFFESKDGTRVTPQALLDLDIYKELAVPLYDGEHTAASVRLLLANLQSELSPKGGALQKGFVWLCGCPASLRAFVARRRRPPPLADGDGGVGGPGGRGLEMRATNHVSYRVDASSKA
jgi:hypothetical protein